MKRVLPQVNTYRKWLNAPRFLSDPIGLMEANIKKYGDSYGFRMGKHPAIFTANPELIQQVLHTRNKRYIKSPPHFEKIAKYLGNGLLTIDGPLWLRQRRLIQPGFSRRRMASTTEIMNLVVDEFFEQLDQKIETGPVDLHSEMQNLAFNLVAHSIFHFHAKGEQLEKLSKRLAFLQAHVIKEMRMPFLVPWLTLKGQVGKAKQAAAEADAILSQLIQERRQSTDSYDDLLQVLLDARYEDNGAYMSDQQLLDEVKILMVAGHDTTGNALSWIWHLLAQHRQWMQAIKEEVEREMAGAVPTYADLPKLRITRQVIEEAMRLYPPAWITDRLAIEADHFQGITIERGTILITFFYGAHRRPAYWQNPEPFRPERFAKGKRKKEKEFACMPFGTGPRRCIGHHLAMLEMTVVLARMVGRYDWQALYEKLDKLALVTLRPKQKVWMKGVKLKG